MKQLLEYLMSVNCGPIADITTLQTILAECWDEFSGSDSEGMMASKLHNRMENVQWEPPMLTFDIERHGGTVQGSTRAERHMWTLNLDKRTASCCRVGHGQVKKMQSKLDIRPMAQQIVQVILDHKEDDQLKWNKDGSVRVQIDKILPAGSAVKQTLEGRRRRFRQEVERLLYKEGWQKSKLNVFTPPAT